LPIGYIANRVGLLLLILWIAISVNFMIPRLMSGGPGEGSASYRARFGPDQPQWKQYLTYWQTLLHGNLDRSPTNFSDRVIDKIKHALPWTLGLLAVSTVLAFSIGTVVGALLAWPSSPRTIKALVPVLMLFSAVPYYLLALILMFLFAYVWAIFPPAGGSTPITILDWNLASAWDIVSHAVLPALSIVLGGIGFWALSMRSMMISVLGEDYINLAEAKGLPPKRIFLWYGMRNAILPQITAVALAMGFILSGAVLVEVVFSYPGLGLILFQAIVRRDFAVIQGIALMLILALGFTLFIVDLIYPLVDPRIRFKR
jgi:peptide/nickel transport system permease protein